ncbi:uncharacterized protein N7477_008839 [Penicillium maclennaniae]|uniref:uncharacterized protein n=1 Tax=Penicillium maclennaniae TaxID=1343394 RepID=UPI0025423C3E|nr:uncharacterized protein N7477_008839 [Penicillium maclennaniae]KAJ5666391.1 hypothetical protein N7477_008839 [Penicillium maclennaniae]
MWTTRTRTNPRKGFRSLRYEHHALPIYLDSSLMIRKGAFCSIALMFNICALVKGWQQSVSADGVIYELHPPGWTTGLKATSLALSVATYMTYTLTMFLHPKSIKGFIVTVIGWFASAIILFSLIGVEVRKHRHAQGQNALTYTQNFFAAVISAGLYVLIAVLLSIYMASMPASPYGQADRRKIEYTSIVFRINTFVILLLGGAAMYSSIEGWSLMDALYFTDYTLLTIGITSLGFVVTAVASFMDRMRELKLECKLKEARREIETTESSKNPAGRAPSQTSLVRSRVPKSEEVLKVRHVKSTFYRKRRWAELGFILVAWFVLWLVSAGIFGYSERKDNWSYFVALYFTYTSLTTIGYGDYYPTSNFGKVFFIFWSLLAIPILTNLVTVMGTVFHIWLVFCTGWIWRHVFRRGRKGKHHHHDYIRRPSDASALIATNKSPTSASRDHGLNVDIRAQRAWETRQGLPCAQVNSIRSDSGEDEQHQLVSRRATTRYRLLLLEEIENLISMTRDESPEHREKLCCTWSRIIPLLQAKVDTGNLAELAALLMSANSEHDIMAKLKNPQKELLERNVEISWMLSLLVEKLVFNIGEELSETNE